MRLAPDVKDTLQRLSLLVNLESQSRRARLKNKNFTIVSNDCWGAEVYKDLNLPFSTPLIGTFVAGPCFMRMIAECDRILRSPITFDGESRYAYVREQKIRQHDYPTGFLDDGNVEIQFLHYASVAEAKTKWEKRVERISSDRLFVKVSGDKDEFTDEHYRLFQSLPLKHKVAFSKEPHRDLPDVVHIPDWTIDGKVMYERALRHFDIVQWLNAP